MNNLTRTFLAATMFTILTILQGCGIIKAQQEADDRETQKTMDTGNAHINDEGNLVIPVTVSYNAPRGQAEHEIKSGKEKFTVNTKGGKTFSKMIEYC